MSAKEIENSTRKQNRKLEKIHQRSNKKKEKLERVYLKMVH